MSEYKASIKSLITHIQTSTDVSAWAKDMSKDLLTKSLIIPADVRVNEYTNIREAFCPRCKGFLRSYRSRVPAGSYCETCGQRITIVW